MEKMSDAGSDVSDVRRVLLVLWSESGQSPLTERELLLAEYLIIYLDSALPLLEPVDHGDGPVAPGWTRVHAMPSLQAGVPRVACGKLMAECRWPHVWAASDRFSDKAYEPQHDNESRCQACLDALSLPGRAVRF